MNADELLRHYERIADAPKAIERLREFVVDLAVRGKLVQQDSDDEPATRLLVRISAERKSAGICEPDGTKQRASKRPPFALPAGWAATTIANVLIELQTGPFGSSLHQTDYQIGGTPVVNPASIQAQRIVPIEKMAVGVSTLRRLGTFKVRTGDIVMARRGEMGRCAVVTDVEHGWLCGTGSLILRQSRLLCPRFLALLIRSPFVREYLSGAAVGATMQNLNQGILLNLAFGLPPSAEQHRIVAQVDELMALCDRLEAARAEREAMRDRLTEASLARLNAPDSESFREDARFVLDALPALSARTEQIKQLRQAILNLAVRGKLVAQDPSDEPAAALLAHIAYDTEQQQLGGRVQRRKGLPVLEVDRAPYDLPVGWAWARFPDLGYFGRGKSKHRPRNDPALFDGGTHLVIQTGDVARSRGLIRTHTSKYNQVGLAQSQKWPAGTLCITIAANIADSGILKFDACFPDSVVGFLPSSVFDSASYFEYFVRTAKANLLEFAPATAQKNINLEILESVLIPLPPLNEQRRIVGRIDELMVLLDKLEQSLLAEARDSARLLDALILEALEPTESLEIAT